MKVIDVFLFYNELDLLEIRLNTLADVVDYFVITEATVTFSGKPKKLYYLENKARFSKFKNKIIHNVVQITPSNFNESVYPHPFFTNRFKSYPHKSRGKPLSSLNLNFQREVYQRDSIMNGLIQIANPDDLIIISDVDEIPNPDAVKQVVKNFESGQIYNFCQKWYLYHLNVFFDREWFGTRITNYEYLCRFSVDLMRFHLENRNEQPGPIVENGGWHFSFLGDEEEVARKLNAYSYQGRRTTFVLKLLDALFPSRIKNKIKDNKDIFNTGRTFTTLKIDETFPPFIYLQQEKFKNYIKSPN